MRIQGFRGNCDSQASWGYAPALPPRTQLVFLGAIQSVSHETLHQNRMTASNEPQANKKFFGAAVFQKCCRGVGEQPTFAKQVKLYNEIKRKSRREPQIAIALKIERL